MNQWPKRKVAQLTLLVEAGMHSFSEIGEIMGITKMQRPARLCGSALQGHGREARATMRSHQRLTRAWTLCTQSWTPYWRARRRRDWYSGSPTTPRDRLIGGCLNDMPNLPRLGQADAPVQQRRPHISANPVPGLHRRRRVLLRRDIVLSPFAGIGTAGYVAIELGRRFVGAELKPSYYRQAVANLRTAERERGRTDLFVEAAQ